jgi:hypothetical protein
MLSHAQLVKVSEAEIDISRELSAFNGSYWKEAKVELQAQHLEMAIWILLFETGNPVGAHCNFVSILKNHMPDFEGINITVSYSVADGKRETILGILDGRGEIFSESFEKRFDKKFQCQVDIDESWIFSTTNSKKN